MRRLPGRNGVSAAAQPLLRPAVTRLLLNALSRSENDDRRSHLHPVIEINDVLIGHAYAAGRYGSADIFRLIGADDAAHRDGIVLAWLSGAPIHGLGSCAATPRGHSG